MNKGRNNSKTKFDPKDTKKVGNRKGNRKGTTRNRDSHGELGVSTNDVSWYNTNPDLTNAAASLNFSQPLGVKFDRGLMRNIRVARDRFDPDNVFDSSYGIPGIMTVHLAPALGDTYTAESAVNVASNAIYSFVRHANSGHSNYDSNDLMIYLLANSQVYSYLNFLIRVYGCATLYSGANKFLPRALVEAQGVDFDDLKANLANFRFAIDMLIIKAQSLAVPANMSYFARHAFLYSKVYAEGTSPKDQLYMYVPDYFWKFALDEDGAGMLQSIPFAMGDESNGQKVNKKTVSELLAFGEELLDAYFYDEDMNIMSGDILKAYGHDGIIKLNTISQISTLVPEYDPTVLTQMKNVKVIGLRNDDSQAGYTVAVPNVKQSSNKAFLTSYGYFTWKSSHSGDVATVAALTSDVVISSPIDTPNVDTVLEITRLISCSNRQEEVGNLVNFYISCGSEVATRVGYWVIDTSASATTFARPLFVKHANTLSSEITSVVSHFKFHPEVMFMDQLGTFYGSFFDIDNFTVQRTETLERIHDAVLINMLAVPSIAAFTTAKRSV